MLELLEKIVAMLIADSTLTALIPAAQILVGPVDMVMEKQSGTNGLLYPQINIRIVSEVQRSNPLNTRDTEIQLDIWGRTSQMEIEQIYERIIENLSYQIENKDTAHIFWMRLNGAVDLYEADRRIFHKAITYSAWSMKPVE